MGGTRKGGGERCRYPEQEAMQSPAARKAVKLKYTEIKKLMNPKAKGG